MLNTEYGVLNYILSLFSIAKINWLGYENALWSVMMVDIWEWTPFVALILDVYKRQEPSVRLFLCTTV